MDTIKSEKIKGHGAAILVNMVFGLNANVTKGLLNGWMTPMGYTITRMIFGATAFWIISFLQGNEKVSRRDLLIILAGGFFGIVLSQAAMPQALTYTTPTMWSLIMALSPIGVLILSALFLKEPVTLRKVAGIIIGISGAALIILGNRNSGMSSNLVLGIGIAAVAVLSYSIHIIIIKKVASRYRPATISKWMFLLALVMMAPLGIPELPAQRLYSPEITIMPVLQLGFALIFSSLLGFFLKPAALRRIKASAFGMYVNIQPITTVTAAIIVGQDVFTWDKPLALALVIAGVYIATGNDGRKTTV
jgi:drug/metabolite transporter (DMT)-like permease